MSFQPLSFLVKDSNSNHGHVESKEKEKEAPKRSGRASLLISKVSTSTLQNVPSEHEKKRSSVLLSSKNVKKGDDPSEAQTVSQLVRKSSLAPKRSIGGSSLVPLLTHHSSSMVLDQLPTKRHSQKDVKQASGNSSLHFDIKAIFQERLEEVSKHLLAFQKEMQIDLQTLGETASLEDELLLENLRERLIEKLKSKWEILRSEVDDLLAISGNEEIESRLLSKIDWQSLGFSDFLKTGSKESLKLATRKKSLKNEKHLAIVRECLKGIILTPVENGFYFEDRDNVKKLVKLYHHDFKGEPRILLAKYIEGLMDLGKVLKEEWSELLKTSKHAMHKPIMAYAREFFARHIHQHLAKELKKEQSENQKMAVALCFQEVGDCIIAYANALKKQEMTQISDAARCLMTYFIKTAEFKQEGIFRQSGVKLVTDQLVMELLKSSSFDISSLKPSTNDMAVALKELFGMMRLFESPELEDKFIQLGTEITRSREELTEEVLIGKLKSLVEELTLDQQKDLKMMLDILGEVSKESGVNKMTPDNLAIVFGPRLCSPTDLAKTMSSVDPIKYVTLNLLLYRDQLFP